MGSFITAPFGSLRCNSLANHISGGVNSPTMWSMWTSADLGRTSSTTGANRGARILTNVGQCYRETQVSQGDVLPRCGPSRPRPAVCLENL